MNISTAHVLQCRFSMSCFFTKQVLEQLALLKYWKEKHGVRLGLLMMVGKHASTCGYGEDSIFSLCGSGARVLAFLDINMLRWGWLLFSHSRRAEQRVFQVPLKREIMALVTMQVNARGAAICRIGPSLKQRDEQVATCTFLRSVPLSPCVCCQE